MTEPAPLQSGTSAPVRGHAPSTARGASPPESSIEFRALLERLREQARNLERSTERPLEAKELPGAVQEAQASLQGALSLAEGLLEAYRAQHLPSP